MTEVVLICSSAETFDEDMEALDNIEPIENINSWLKENKHSKLKHLSKKLVTDGKVFCSPIYGGAFNFLETKEFKKVVLNQKWQEPTAVILLMQGETDIGFNVFKVPKKPK
jgi:hypothetical protein